MPKTTSRNTKHFKCKTINLSRQLLLCSLHYGHNTIPLRHQRAQNITTESTAQHTIIQGAKITGDETNPHGITRQHLRGKAQCVLNPWSHDTTRRGGQASSQSALLTILSVPPFIKPLPDPTKDACHSTNNQ